LTGTPQQVEAISKSYRVSIGISLLSYLKTQVYSSKPRNNLGESEDDDYLVDHSIILYFMNGDGKFLEFYGQNAKPDQVAESMKKHIIKGKEEFDPLWKKILRTVGVVE
jgi:cytochrome oxidase Cu insertion factor (SCO1/SenC/PrrC family)